MAQRQFQQGIIRENARGEREILIPVQMHTSSSRSHQTYEGDSEIEQHEDERMALLKEVDVWKVPDATYLQSKCMHQEQHLQQLSHFIKQFQKLSDEHKQLEEAYEEKDAEAEQAKQSVKELEALIDEVKQQLGKLEDQNADLNNQVKKRKAEIADLQKKFAGELHQKDEELEKVRQERNRQETEQKKKRKTLEAELSKLSDEKIDLEAENKRLQDSIDRLKREMAGFKATLNEYQMRDDTAVQQPLPSRREKSSESENYLRIQIEQLTADFKLKEQQIEEQHAKDSERLNKLRLQLEQARKQLRQCKSRCDELTSANSQYQSTNTEMSETIQKYEKEIESLKGNRKPAEKCNHPAKIKTLEEEIERLRDQLKDQSVIFSSQKEQTEELARLRAQLREEKAISKKAISSMEKTIAGLQNSVAVFEQRNAELEKTVSKLEEQLREERNENSRLVGLLDRREKELAQVTAKKVVQEKEPSPAGVFSETEEEYQKMLRELKRDIDQKNASNKKVVEELQAQITELRNRLQRQASFEQHKPIIVQPPTPPAKPVFKPCQQCPSLKELLQAKQAELLEARTRYDELQRFHMTSLASLEQQNMQLIRLLETERFQFSNKDLSLSESKKIIARLQTEIERLNGQLQSVKLKNCNSSMVFREKENRLVLLERRLLKSEQGMMREDQRQIYQAKITRMNELVELLSLKLHNLQQEFIRRVGPPGICFYH